MAFVVLTAAETEARAASLRQTALDADARGRGLGVFCFTTFASWSLESPEFS